MHTKLFALAAAMAFSATSAIAADAIIYEPQPPEAPAYAVYDWTGAYLGIQGGYAWTSIANPGLVDEEFDGGFFGGHAGYNFQNGNYVFGIEGDINYNWNEQTFGAADIGIDWDGSLRGRLGYAWDRTQLYGTAGLAVARGYIEAPGFDESETFVGWTIGAGVEHAFTDNILARVEYRYSDFGAEDFGLGLGDFDIDQHKVTLGVSYKF